MVKFDPSQNTMLRTTFLLSDYFLTEYWNISGEDTMSVFLRGPGEGRSQSRAPSAAPEPEPLTQNRPLATDEKSKFVLFSKFNYNVF